MWWMWALGGLVVWFGVALLAAVVVGRGIRLADDRELAAGAAAVLTSADIPGTSRRAATRSVRRRAVPLPAFGVALLGVAVALETVGYVVRLTGATGPTARMLSMDAPFSLPRLFVATLFAAAALAAVAGASNDPGRRTWWLAVGGVAAMIAAVKAGSTVHAEAISMLAGAIGSLGAVLVSAVGAGAVISGLWFLSRHERRDRRRVLGVLALYAGAAVGLSAVTSAVAGVATRGSSWVATAAFLEESGEALAGAAFLIAVLAGVAPRLVLPQAWALRRAADVASLELPERLPGRAAPEGPFSP